MSDNFMVVTPEELISGQVLPTEMTEDLRRVAEIPEEIAHRVSEVLKETTGISTLERVEEIVSDHIDDEEIVEAVTRTLLNIPPGQERQITALLDRWRCAKDERRAHFSDSDFEALDRNLKILIQDYPSLLLMRKANRLLRDTGNEFEDVLFVCDLRPVFDRSHKTVEGFVALANLRLRYIRQNGERDTFELALTDQELEELKTAADDAIRKLDVLKSKLGNLLD